MPASASGTEVQRHVELVRPDEVRRRAARLHRPDLPARRSPRRPARSASRTVVPIGTQYTSGRSTCPETAKNFQPTESPTPWSCHHCAPRCTMIGTSAKVSTEFISVGRPCRPVDAGERRLVARLAAVALHALEQRGLLAEDVAARARRTPRRPAAARCRSTSVPIRRLPRAAPRSRRAARASSGPYSCRMKTQPSSAPTTTMPEQQALEHQVRLLGQDLAVLEGARLGLVGVADGVLELGLGCVPRTSSHFCPVGKPAPPIPRSPESFSVRTIVVRVQLAGQQRAQDWRSARRRRPAVGVVRPRLAARLGRAAPCVGVAGRARRRPARRRRRRAPAARRRSPPARCRSGPRQDTSTHLDLGVVAVARVQLARCRVVAVVQPARQVVADRAAPPSPAASVRKCG